MIAINENKSPQIPGLRLPNIPDVDISISVHHASGQQMGLVFYNARRKHPWRAVCCIPPDRPTQCKYFSELNDAILFITKSVYP